MINHSELIALFVDCIKTKKYIDNRNQNTVWYKGSQDETSFNLYNFYRPRIYFTEPAKCLERPDVILFYQHGISAVVEAKTSRSDFLADFKKKHRKAGQGMGDYKYILCDEDIDIKELPAEWGILRIKDIGKRKPYLYMHKQAVRQSKNFYEEIELLTMLLNGGKND